MDLVTCCIVLCSVDSTFTDVCIPFGVFIFVIKMFICTCILDTADKSKQHFTFCIAIHIRI